MRVCEQKKSPDGPGSDLGYHLFGGARRAVVAVRVASSSGVVRRAGLVTPAMKRSTSLIALSVERQA